MIFMDYSYDIIAVVFYDWLDGKDFSLTDSAYCNVQQRAILLGVFSADCFKKPSLNLGGLVSGLNWLNSRGLKVEKLSFGRNLYKILNNTIICDLDRTVFSKTIELNFTNGLGGRAEHYPSFYLPKWHKFVNVCIHLQTLNFKQQSMKIEIDFLLGGIYPTILGNLTSLTCVCSFDSINKSAIRTITECCLVLQELTIRCGKDRCRGSDFNTIISNNSQTLRILNLSHCDGIDEQFIEFVAENLSAVLIELNLKNCHDSNNNTKQMLCDLNPVPFLLRKCKQVQVVLISFYKLLPGSYRTCRGMRYDVRRKKLYVFGPNANILFRLFCTCIDMHEIIVRDMSDWTDEVICNMLTHSPNLKVFSVVDLNFTSTVFTVDMLRRILYHPSMLSVRIEGCKYFSGNIIQNLFVAHPDKHQIKSFFMAYNQDYQFSHMVNITTASLGLMEIGVYCCGIHIDGVLSSSDEEQPLIVSVLTAKRPHLKVKYNIFVVDDFVTFSFNPWN
jgi:hypothetical protein